MNEIYERRSIRKYTGHEVEKEKIVKMLDAAMNAPTAMNKQEWRFIVVQDQAVLNEISDNHPYAKMIKESSSAIIVCGDKEVSINDEFIYTDCGAAIQNMLLTAVTEGLGTCWCAIGPSEERIQAVQSILKLENNLLPVACVAVGYAAEQKDRNNRYDEKKVRWM